MGSKRTKQPAKRAPRARPAAAPPAYDTEAKLRMLADGFSDTFATILGSLNKDGVHEWTLKQLARTGTALTSTLAELRQHAKASARAIESLPVEQLVARLKTLDPDQRRNVCRELMEEDAEGPVL